MKTADIQSAKEHTASGNGKRKPFFQPQEETAIVKEQTHSDHQAPVQRRVLMPLIQPKCRHCEEEEQLQRKENDPGAAEHETPAIVGDAINNNGAPLDENTRSFMEQRFGYDFSQVKIHTGTVAAKSADAINAQAYTSGNSIVFNANKYQPDTHAGKSLLAHELTHVIQQRGNIQRRHLVQRQPAAAPTQAQLNQMCYDPSVTQPNPSAANPELHPTYAGWIGSFTGMATFTSNDTASGIANNRFTVLGTEGAALGDTSATAETEAVPVTGSSAAGEAFIDHPTNQWVVNCLPANLRATAYQLPADCADIAVILRHVWLSAHHRTETYNGWTVGDDAGRANQARARELIRDVYSGNVRHMVNPYTDASGTPLTNFTQLQNLLHVGDVLVWEHRESVTTGHRTTARRTGGHTQTINRITRSGGNVTGIEVLQGNQPIFSDAATAILQSQGARNTDPDSPAGHALRDLPGRRIESDTAISIANITDPVTNNTIWGLLEGGNDYTVLIVAGPPRAASRPTAGRGGRTITDWRSSIQRARTATLAGVLEATLQEARSIIEQGAAAANPVTSTDMATLGQDLGQRVVSLYSSPTDRIQQIQQFITVIRALRNDTTSAGTAAMFNSFEQAFAQHALPNATTEERRLFTEHASLSSFLLPFASQITAFATALAGARTIAAARTVAEQHGTLLWQAATALSQAATGGSNDDRPLYWSRLRMIEEIRQFTPRFRLSATDRQQLIDLFEQASRGIPSSSSTSVFPTTTAKRILISGFDPFGLDTSIGDSNPSGAIVLALDGTAISAGTATGRVEGVVFPVRYRDFDAGTIENFFRPYLNSTHPVNMIMTISQGDAHFDIEQWAGRRRSTDNFADNEGTIIGSPSNPVEPPGIAAGNEFLHTRLPHTAMSNVPDTRLHGGRTPAPPSTGPAVEGSGGGFLSNEIFYRTRLLQETIGGTAVNIPLGHLHVPANMSRQNVINRVREILQAALPGI